MSNTIDVKQASVYSLLGTEVADGTKNIETVANNRAASTINYNELGLKGETRAVRRSVSSASRAAGRARQRVAAEFEKQRRQQASRQQVAHDFNALFVSEWLTQHPLTMSYPSPIWLHSDCPAAPASGVDANLQRVRYLNEAGIVHQQEGRLDDSLAAFKEMEGVIKKSMPAGKARLAYLAVAYNNVAGFYFRKSMMAPALQYCERAATLEERAHGAIDCMTKSRLACIHSRGKERGRALALTQAVLGELKAMANTPSPQAAQAHAPAPGGFDLPSCGGSLLRFDSNSGGALVRGTPLFAAYRAHLAVAYHNLAVQLALCQELQQASAAVHCADQLAAEALPAKHRWAKHICATVQKLRDMHVSSQFVQHSIRPRLAVFEARQAASGELSLSTSLPAIRRA